MKFIEVNSSGPLAGTVRIPGSKNSSLALIAAASMAEEPVVLKGLPNILDFRVIETIAAEIGIRIVRDEEAQVTIDASDLHSGELNPQLTSAYRASYYFVGALLAKRGTVSIGFPGGDDFVSRPIDQHVKVLRSLGATVDFFERHYVVKASRLKGAVIYFDTITSGATINAMLLAALAEGVTELRNAARDPEVVDTANLLNLMGAKVSGAGTEQIRIQGVKQLRGCSYNVIPDRLIAGAFLMAAGATRGTITVDDIIPEHLGSCLAKLKETGLELDVRDSSITAYGDMPLRAVRVRTGMYPLFATDLQQPLTPLLLRAQGRSIIADKVYPHRFNHVPQLVRMGASIRVRGGAAYIDGAAKLHGAYVHASDVRAGMCLIVAGLMADGVTRIAGVEHIERGNENVIGMFRQLGANLTLTSDAASAEGTAAEQA
ncbi:MAG: UDP-N-acetylglucosamine 1-carboxyvinyltransferase [Paenibacillaceae bacterium]|nr:UDP-N-acetylglucosamine 1-carboxyvinyltransferase [Paenibacillaceae bacterium]